MVRGCILYNHHNPKFVELDLVMAGEGLQFEE